LRLRSINWIRNSIVPNSDARSVAAIQRKLRGLAAILDDPATTENERANARVLKLRLLQQLPEEVRAGGGKLSGLMFRLGRGVRQARELKDETTPPAPKGDWTDHAYRLGKVLRRGLNSKKP
jgi:hypothetical protein